MRIGYFLSSEEHGPGALVRQAQLAEDHGLCGLWISDHYHPWNSAQGQSPFVWTTLGALARATMLPLTTAVTCPTTRLHPAVIAQAAATVSVLSEGRFTLGVGTGEALNEHILGGRWPHADIRLAMLEEAVEIIRDLFSGEVVNHVGEYYEVEHARLYTVPESPVAIYVSGFGPSSASLAGRIGDGFVCTKADSALTSAFKAAGGAGKPMQAGMKVCWAPSKDDAVATAYRYWSNDPLPGELAQVLPTPEHFEQASTLVTPDMVAENIPCGPDPEPYVEAFRKYADVGYDELFVQQIGPDQEEFFTFFAKEVEPLLAA
ncbi:MAG TPA: TIGR03557 family F420-dependent LLM class oxidoreductase [Acidothermaceae bacterium]